MVGLRGLLTYFCHYIFSIMAQKPSIPKGTRDFGPEEVQKRQYIINILRKHFETFGFQPIETPSFENVETLTGKYGDEGDRLIFKILPRGEKLNKAQQQGNVEQVVEEALRYDLTVPFARFVVQHQNELAFPFKRYQIQPVWRADRPQKGRFREFYQCDADVVGSKSLWQEVELAQLYDRVFAELNLPVTIRINNRKVLAGIAEALGIASQMTDFTVALDKLDKVGLEGVLQEMGERGISDQAIADLRPILSKTDDLDAMAEMLNKTTIGQEGLRELQFVQTQVQKAGLKNKLHFDATLARGLNYYTGAIFEVSANGVQMGSIGGGGRYDDLTGIFGMKDLSGIGISFGLDRIYLCLEELNLFPQTTQAVLDVLFLNFGESEMEAAQKILLALRDNGIAAVAYPDSAKLKKQFDYAAKRGTRFVAFYGEKEIEAGEVMLKNQEDGTQKALKISALSDFLLNR